MATEVLSRRKLQPFRRLSSIARALCRSFAVRGFRLKKIKEKNLKGKGESGGVSFW